MIRENTHKRKNTENMTIVLLLLLLLLTAVYYIASYASNTYCGSLSTALQRYDVSCFTNGHNDIEPFIQFLWSDETNVQVLVISKKLHDIYVNIRKWSEKILIKGKIHKKITMVLILSFNPRVYLHIQICQFLLRINVNTSSAVSLLYLYDIETH